MGALEVTRGTSNSNVKPSWATRKKLKQLCLDRDGDGITVLCAGTCGRRLTFSEVSLDRHPVAGIDGGRYKPDNVRAMCVPCNASDGSLRMHARLGHRLKGDTIVDTLEIEISIDLDRLF
ncbi:MAG: hypothetical protein JWN41_1809 [Thermoleophilia bacterium]|nr:hypothetical protein [Thermoleophilia bacterium]